jgi:hypothetical protein
MSLAIKEGHCAVKKYNEWTTDIDLRVKLSSPYFDVALGATGTI